jgi:hypothetical protein
MQFINAPQDGASEASYRSKVISFRVSSEEYGEVEAASRRQGFKSVALFARSVVLTEKIDDPTLTAVDCDINRLWRRIEGLVLALEELTVQLSTIHA